MPHTHTHKHTRHFDSATAQYFDNVTNELFRNHLSLVKDLVPEMGRNFRVVWNVGF